MKAKQYTLFCYIAVLCFVMGSSAFLKTIGVLSMAINAVEAFVVIYCFLHLVGKSKNNVYRNLIFLFYIFLGISTILSSKQYFTYVVYAIQALGATLFFQYGFKKNVRETLRVTRNVLFIMLLLNLIFMIVKPTGFMEYNANSVYYLLGLRIAFSPFVICAIFYSVLYDCLVGNNMSKFTILVFVIGYLNLVLQFVATGVVTVTALVVLVFFFLKRDNIFKFEYFIGAYIVCFVAIVVFNIQYHIPFFSYFLEEVLGKDLTFDNRTTIWAAAISNFLKNPILGTGATGGGGITVYFQYRIATLNAHNQILNMLCEGGIVSLGVFAMMCANIGKVLNRYRNNPMGKITTCVILAFFLMMLTEVQMTKALIFMVFATAAFLPDVIDEKMYKGRYK
jgi:O-antigen ligase